ncbi:hypothetical protein B0H12DRAFT_1246229 [Mycena haematopus]|nr:hypothetical protein B0H12DRAFT_1246229 [Mycena haematopus]
MYNDYDDDDDEYRQYLEEERRFHGDEGQNEEQAQGQQDQNNPEHGNTAGTTYLDSLGITELHLEEESEYNDGQGIRIVTNYQPQLPPLVPGEKRRANARAPLINRTIYVHEKSSFAEVLDAVFAAVGQDEQTIPFKVVGDSLRTTRFTATWSIARTNFKKMQLQSVKDFGEMMKQALLKGSPEAKLDITELLAPTTATTSSNVPEEGEKTSKKRKLTAEEEEMAETVIQLQGANRCSDRTCGSRFCFVGNPTGQHIRLTPAHFNIWSAAILAKMPNVDINNPPPPDEEKMFWPVEQPGAETDDIAMLARRRVAATKSQSAPTITINNDYAGLAAILQPLLAGSSSTATASAPALPSTPINPSSSRSFFASPAKPASMSMAEFGIAFKLSIDTLERLEPLSLDGPHLLEFVENAVLDQHLTINQRAALRYAESQWKKGKIQS